VIEFLKIFKQNERIPILILFGKLGVSGLLFALSGYLVVRGSLTESEIMIASNINTGLLAYWLASSHSPRVSGGEVNAEINSGSKSEVTVNSES
jgi:hypothetical protein